MQHTQQPPKTSTWASCLTLATALFVGSSNRESFAADVVNASAPSPINPIQLATFTENLPTLQQNDPVFPNEGRNLARHVTSLAPRLVNPNVAQSLIEQNRMVNAATGIVFDEKHLILVSWDQRGLIFEKSAFRSPNASHSAAIALRSQIEAITAEDQTVRHVLKQSVTVISFLPDTVPGITAHVRIFPAAFEDPRGVGGRNWQSLDLLLAPNQFLDSTPIQVSASRLIKINDEMYRAFVHRAHDLDASGTRYFVLGSTQANRNAENCIGALKGVAHYLPRVIGEPAAPRTFTMRGEEATNFVALDLLHRGSIAPQGGGFFAHASDNFLIESFLANVPAAHSRSVSWYSLRAKR